VQAGRSQRLPLQGDLYRVVGEDCLLFIIALVEANALAVSDVYGRYNIRDNLPIAYRLILEYLRHGRARNALLSLSLFSRTSSERFITLRVSLGMMTSSM
jgi:hypothetical protein